MEDSEINTDTENIEEMVMEYFKFHGMTSSLKKFDEERKKKKGAYEDPEDKEDGPFLNQIWSEENKKEAKESEIEGEFKELERQHSSVLQSARQIFSIAINCLQQLHNIKDVSSFST